MKEFYLYLKKIEIETNINKIKGIARSKEDENYKFHSFLKGCDCEKLDVIVHRLYRYISSKIDCKICGNCSKKVLPVLYHKDIKIKKVLRLLQYAPYRHLAIYWGIIHIFIYFVLMVVLMIMAHFMQLL